MVDIESFGAFQKCYEVERSLEIFSTSSSWIV
jgi:hypothetical protein